MLTFPITFPPYFKLLPALSDLTRPTHIKDFFFSPSSEVFPHLSLSREEFLYPAGRIPCAVLPPKPRSLINIVCCAMCSGYVYACVYAVRVCVCMCVIFKIFRFKRPLSPRPATELTKRSMRCHCVCVSLYPDLLL